MRRTLRQLSAVKPSRFLEPGTPTGLAGLLTHPSPRGTLLYTYARTLDALKQLPESSVYRQSTEAVTKHRQQIVASVIPEGYEAWKQKAEQVVKEHPEVFTTPEGGVPHDEEKHVKKTVGGGVFMITKPEPEFDELETEWDGEENTGPELEGTRTKEERAKQGTWGGERPGSDEKTVTLDPEPPLSVEQIGEIENRIGAGLIEEVLQVAEGELKLVSTMLNAKVWEDLEEKPAEGQWTYFDRQKN